MIIRENETEFIMISQHDHAAVSEKFIERLQENYFPRDDLNNSVLYAIRMHDCGWENFDKEPVWNDEARAPYSFIDFPLAAKTVLYKHGIDEVEKNDSYAALLCSEHYSRFLANESTPEARAFVAYEQARQLTIIDENGRNNHLFTFHYELLQFADSLSLFLCLNEPGSGKESVHPFFKNGIPLPAALEEQLGKKLELEWLDEGTVACEPFPFQEPIELSIIQKRIPKDSISKHGVRKSYLEAPEAYLNLKVI